MFQTLQRQTLFALYQLTVAFGILMMPLALVARRVGVRLPVGRVVDAVAAAYEDVSTQ